jgi:hypothetical protein
MTYRLKAPAVIDASMVIVEQLYAKHGADGLAKIMAKALRDPMPRQEILHSVARLLDPGPNDDLRLVVERRRRGNTKMQWTKRSEDIELSLEVLEWLLDYLAAGNPKRGSIKKAVGAVADNRSMSEGKVRQALKVRSLIPNIRK